MGVESLPKRVVRHCGALAANSFIQNLNDNCLNDSGYTMQESVEVTKLDNRILHKHFQDS
jgi:hypothetical protein